MGTDQSSTGLRLCLVAQALRRQDGQGRVNLEIAKVALSRGFTLTILAVNCAEELANHPNVRWIPIRGASLPTQLLRDIVFANRTARWLREHRDEYDLVQANGFVTWEPCDIVAVHFVHTAWLRSSSFPFRLFSLHPRSWYQWLYTVLNARWEQRAFKRAQVILAVSRRTAAEVEKLGVNHRPVEVIYNGVDAGEFKPGAACREQFGLPEGVPLALFVGDIQTPRKNLPTVLAAMQHLPDLHLAVAASTKGSPYVKMARLMNIGERVHFLGKTSKVPDLMRSADVMVFPSRYEAHPLVVLEALACGLPTIVSAVIAKGESFANACVLLEDANDAPQLAREIQKLLSDPQRRADLVESGFRAVRELSWEETGQQYVAIYELMLQKLRAA